MKTVRVRIAVAMDRLGRYACSGWARKGGSPDDSILQRDALDGLDPNSTRHHVVYIEADVPLPEPVTVEGKVTT